MCVCLVVFVGKFMKIVIETRENCHLSIFWNLYMQMQDCDVPIIISHSIITTSAKQTSYMVLVYMYRCDIWYIVLLNMWNCTIAVSSFQTFTNVEKRGNWKKKLLIVELIFFLKSFIFIVLSHNSVLSNFLQTQSESKMDFWIVLKSIAKNWQSAKIKF